MSQLRFPIRFFFGFALLLCLTVPFGHRSHAQERQVRYFVDETARAGLDAVRSGTDRAIGQAWGDVDGDGWLDLYVTDSDGPNKLFINQQDGTFMQREDDVISQGRELSGGAVFADYDNDGWDDLYLLNWGPNALFHNEAGQGFTNVSLEAGVADDGNGQTASWGDYDNDGYLDLYVANWACYPQCGRPSTGDIDRLYHNNGDGTFTDVTRILGSKTVGAGFVASFVDFDNDGDLDIYLVNDEFINPIGNVLWRNDGPGCNEWCFVDIAEEANADNQLMGMGLATSDYDNDGDLDFYFSNAGPMVLLQNQGDSTFANVAAESGVENANGVGWGAVFFDFNNDGWDDLYVAIMTGTKGRDARNPLYRNNGFGQFMDVTGRSGVANDGKTLGVAYADYNNDGWVDLVIGNHDEAYHLYRNQTAVLEPNQWLALNLIGAGEINRNAVGARVYVTDGERTQLQEVKVGSSLGAGNSRVLHFGLGTSTTADRILVRWPNGDETSYENIPTNRQYDILYGSETPLYTPPPPDTSGIFTLLLWGLLGGILFIVPLAFVFQIIETPPSSPYSAE